MWCYWIVLIMLLDSSLALTIKPPPSVTTKKTINKPNNISINYTTMKPITNPTTKPLVKLPTNPTLKPFAKLPTTMLKTVSSAKPLLQNDLIVETTTKFNMAQTEDVRNQMEFIKLIRSKARGYPNPESGKRLSEWRSYSNKGTPEEQGTYFQGDVLHPVTATVLRQGLMEVESRWPQGIIYYELDPRFTPVEVLLIQNAMNEYHKNTCIKFVPYSGNEQDYMSIERENTGCWSYLGRVGGKQMLNLQSPNCLYYVGTVIHELMHTVGFFHHQSRIDRDSAVLINWDNIAPGRETNFAIYNSTTFNMAYDYGSVMHYSQYAFSKDGSNTIVPLIPGATIGQRQGFSAEDIEVIRIMYKCVGNVSLLN